MPILDSFVNLAVSLCLLHIAS